MKWSEECDPTQSRNASGAPTQRSVPTTMVTGKLGDGESRMAGCTMLTTLVLQLPRNAPMHSLFLPDCKCLEMATVVGAQLKTVNLASCSELNTLSLQCDSLEELTLSQVCGQGIPGEAASHGSRQSFIDVPALASRVYDFPVARIIAAYTYR
jgi:hypothetical protein